MSFRLMKRPIVRMAESRSRKAARLRWVFVLLVTLALSAGIFLSSRDRKENAKTALEQSSVTQPKTDGGAFPPALADPRPDLSTRADYVDVCGVGRVRMQSDGQLDLPADATSGQRLVEAAASKFASSDSDFERALALYVASALAARTEPLKEAAQSRLAAESVQQLARLALGARDPAAYALAFYACARAAVTASNAGACAQISAAQWTLLDPDNAAPWLYEAAAARRRNDPGAVDEALLRASRAKTLRPYNETPLRLIEAPAVRSAPPAQAGAAMTALIGLSSALPLPNLQLVSRYCAATPSGAAEHTQTCSGLAGVLTERSTVVLGMQLGAMVGERTGWPSERVTAARMRLADLQKARTRAIDPKDLYSCVAIERSREYLTAYARYGEVGAMERVGALGQRNIK